MATSAWFDYNGYMANKLAQLQKADSAAGWDMVKLVKAFADAGFVGDKGAEQHFQAHGQYEDVAPNAFFNATEYYRAKAADFYKKDPKAVTDLDAASIQVAIKDSGMSAWSHYEMFGNAEGINASNSFNTALYMNAKLAALNAVKDGKQWTLSEVNEAFKAAGLSALEHFMLYGGLGAGEVAQKYDPAKPAIPAEFAVPEEQKVNGGGSDGTFIELTEKIDNLQGTAGNDVFVGTAGTTQTMDSIHGNGGEDILRLDDTTALPGVIKGVQTFSFENNTDALSHDLSAYADLKHVVIKDAAAGTTLTVASGVDVAYTGTLTTETVHFKGTDGKEDAATLKFNNATFTTKAVVGAKSATVQGIEKLTIEATGKNDVLTLDDAALTDLLLKGEGSFKAMGTTNADLGGAGTIKAINAADLKGGVELFLTNTKFAADATITGGAGNDTFKFTGLLNKGIVLKGGTAEGDNDTLIFGASVNLNTAAEMKAFAQFSEFETLAVTGATVDLNVDRTLMADVKTFKVDNTGQMTITNALGGDHFIHGGSGSTVTADTITITMAGGETGKISLELQGGVDLASNALQLKGSNAFDLISNDIAGGGVNKIKITNDAGANLTPNTTVNVEGDTSLHITAGTIADDEDMGLNVKAGNFTGDLTVTGSVGIDYIVGGKGHNVITGGTGIDTIDLAASKGVQDTVNLSTVLLAADGDIIKAFEVGATGTADIISLNGSAGAVTMKAVVEGGKLTLAQTTTAGTVNELSGDLGADAATGAGVLSHLNAATNAESDKGHLIVYGEGKAYLYYVLENAGSSALQAADFHLIGTFEGVTAGGFENGNVVW